MKAPPPRITLVAAMTAMTVVTALTAMAAVAEACGFVYFHFLNNDFIKHNDSFYVSMTGGEIGSVATGLSSAT